VAGGRVDAGLVQCAANQRAVGVVTKDAGVLHAGAKASAGHERGGNLASRLGGQGMQLELFVGGWCARYRGEDVHGVFADAEYVERPCSEWWKGPRSLTFAFLLHTVGPVQPLTKRQREILDYLQEFIQQHGYAPSLEEVGRRFGLSSLATVHKHLTNLEEKGCIRRLWNRSRSVELLSARTGHRAVELPMLGYVAAGLPIEAVTGSETIAVPEDLVGRRDTYVLKVKVDSMIDEQIRDGDFVIVEDRKTAENGEMVIALLGGG
jgi:repressor LexA